MSQFTIIQGNVKCITLFDQKYVYSCILHKLSFIRPTYYTFENNFMDHDGISQTPENQCNICFKILKNKLGVSIHKGKMHPKYVSLYLQLAYMRKV